MYYGLINRQQAIEIIDKVVEVIGGNHAVKCLLLETAMQETHCGEYRDPTPYAAGMGVGQCDQVPFYDVVARTPSKYKELISAEFGINLDDARWRELELSPVLAFIIMRLHYRLIPEAVPDTVEGRAAYWKKYYNTELGKGTVEEYIENAGRL